MYAYLCHSIFLLFCLLLSGCGLFSHISEQRQQEEDILFDYDPLPYHTVIRISGEAGGSPALAKAMEQHSQLIQLHNKLPDGTLALMRRARSDQQNAVKLLQSLGYYDGEAHFELEEPKESQTMAEVTLTLTPGIRYRLGTAAISYSFSPEGRIPPENIPENVFPKELPLEKESFAEAELILNSIEEILKNLRRNGYPSAHLLSSQYTLNRADKALNALITIDPGPYTVMNSVVISGTEHVSEAYLKKYIPWKTGEPWNEDKIQRYRGELQKLGLFSAVELKSASPEQGRKLEDTGAMELPVLVNLRESSFRTVGAGARYATDTGMGLEGEWQHRNLFGSGEKLTLNAPFAEDKKGLQATFEKPFFGNRSQKFLAGASYLKENTEAYESKSLNAYAGIERKISSAWWGSIKLFGEEGTVTRSTDDTYQYASIIAALRRDTRSSLMNPRRGSYIQWEAAPTVGRCKKDFSGISTKITAALYYASGDEDSPVFAARTTAGSFLGVSMPHLPPVLRFYCGGGGSVRGYSYQSIGMRDTNGDPLGGRSFHEVNLEVRFRINEQIGITPFLDGGMVYEDELPPLFKDFQWGAGIGLRYFTPIGPLRFDVSTPLNKKHDDKEFQIYIGIGQAF